MTSETPLPDPWRERRTLEPAEADTLESVIGSRLTFEDLGEHDTIRLSPNGYVPASERAMRVMGHKWIELENVDTDATVIVRLQHDMEQRVSVSSVVFPFEDGQDITGASLRALPIAALNAAFTRHEQRGKANIKILLALGDAIKEDPLTPLPAASARDSFTARVARQFMALEERDPTVNVATAMAEHNSAAKSSVQRWIARARKQGFLPPADPKRSHGTR